MRPDPGVELVVGCDVTWNSAFLLGRGGETLTVTVSVETPYVREDDGALSETWRILLKAPPG